VRRAGPEGLATVYKRAGKKMENNGGLRFSDIFLFLIWYLVLKRNGSLIVILNIMITL
jgi:hypothetical protein